MEQPIDPPDLNYGCRRCDGPCEREGDLCHNCVEDEGDLIREDRYKEYYE